MMKCLVVDKPYCDLIVDGMKMWELRSRSTNIRGRIGIIEKGTGTIIGEVDLVGVIGPMDDATILASSNKHHLTYIPDGFKWRYAWVLNNAVRYPTPISYTHPQGAVIWVNVDCI